MTRSTSSSETPTRLLSLSDPAAWEEIQKLRDSPVWRALEALLRGERAELLECLRERDRYDAAIAVLDWLDDFLLRMDAAQEIELTDPYRVNSGGNPYIEMSSDPIR